MNLVIRRAALLAMTLLPLAGCVVGPSVIANPYPAPPPARSETMPKPPVSEEAQIWQPGHWDWIGGGYAWTAGSWVTQAGHGRHWQEGYWSDRSGAWRWNPAHWLDG